MRNPLVALKARSINPLPFDEWVSAFTLDNFWPRTTLASTREEIEDNFSGLINGAYKRNGIVFACMLARQLLFSEARFQFQEMRGGRPGDLFGNESLSILEHPWPGATTGDLLARAIQDADLAGNHFSALRRRRIKRMRPDWVTIVLGSLDEEDPEMDAWDLDAELLGYIYHPGGRYSDHDPVYLLREQVAHFAPIPDPEASYRGMSWITPIIREVIADSAARDHKVKFFENGATPNLFVSLDIEDPNKFKRWVEGFDAEHRGAANAYKTLFLGAGSSATVVGNSFQQIDFKTVQGAGEVRIAAASGIHPVIVGLSEGLSGSSLNAGNFTAARRLTADKTLRPMWRNFAGSMETIVPAPSGSRLWYDERDIPFLADDIKDSADVQAQQASAMRQLVDAGFKPETVIDAIVSGDFKRLTHSGLMSVQLLPPGTMADPKPEEPPAPEPDDELNSARSMLQLAQFALGQRSSPQVTIEDGAFRIETPVTVEPTQIHFPEGFVRSETTVEPTHVTIEEGAVRIDSPITVEPAQLTIAEGAIRSETPVTVNAPDVKIEEGAVRIDSPVTVEPAQVTVESPVPEQRSRTVRKDVKHDTKGRITQIIETEE